MFYDLKLVQSKNGVVRRLIIHDEYGLGRPNQCV